MKAVSRTAERGRAALSLVVLVSFLPHCTEANELPTSGTVSWPQAQRLLRGCAVKYAEQTHQRNVTLKLWGGTTVFTREPQLDDLIHEVTRVPENCPHITFATE
jgi:hypothetical protein